MQGLALNSSLKQSFDDYVAYIGLSKGERTITAYIGNVRRFLAYAQSRGVKRVSGLKTSAIITYLSYLQAQGKTPSTLNQFYMAIRNFIGFLRITSLIESDIITGVPVPRVKQIAPYVPTVCEIEALLNAINTDSLAGLRDKAILETLYSSGLRATELCDLEYGDYNREGYLFVRSGKGEKSRTVPLTDSAIDSIEHYIGSRGTEADYLFRTLQGRRIRRQLLTAIVLHYAKKAALPHITAHTLRHACATHLLNQGADLRLIQEVLGHASITSTQRYTQLSSSKIQEMFKHFHPRKHNNGENIYNHGA